MQPIQSFFPQLNTAKNIVITAHQKPDGDAMGSSLGLLHFLIQLGHHVTYISPTNWASFLEWMPGSNEVLDYEKNRAQAAAIVKAADIIFCLDFNILHRVKNFEPVIRSSKAIKVLIDHHELPEVEAFDYGISLTSKSSTCEMVYDFIVDSGHDHLINLKIATCLYTGVMTDTGSFRFPSTTASVHRMVARLKETGLQHSPIHDNMFDNFLENRLRFMGHAFMHRMEVLYQYNTVVMSIPKKDLLKYDIKTGDTEGLVNWLLTIQGIKLAAIVIDRDEERKWSFRSKGNFDVNIFARRHFEGGGHKNASGGRSSDSVEATTEKFYEVIRQYEKELN